MGCVQARGLNKTPPTTLERLKEENGYVRGSDRREMARPVRIVKDEDEKTLSSGRQLAKSFSGSEGESGRIREGERGGAADGSVSRRYTVKKIGADEVVDGWPKWLLDNIPRKFLAGLVPKTADSYDKISKVGHGTYSNVYKARDRNTGKIVALKKVRFDTSDPESIKFMAREIILLRQLDHPNIIKLEGIATSRMQYSLYLVFDFMPSDLTRLITGPGARLTEPQVKRYMEQLLSGLQHCHEKGILHRDIKGSNLLIDRNGTLKIADFGLANYYHPRSRRPLTSRVVTLWYRAPELLLGSTDYGVGIDLWSAGCLLAEMFLRKPIMPGRNEIEQLHKIFKLCGSPSEEYWKKLKPSTTFRPPQCRSSFQEVFRNLPDSAVCLLNQLLCVDPAYRGTAASALQNEFFSTSPLACDVKDLPVTISNEDDNLVHFNDQKRKRALRAKQRRLKSLGHTSTDDSTETSSKEEKRGEDSSLQSYTTTNSTSSTSSSQKPSRIYRDSPPPSPIPVFQTQLNRSATTEAHPNALKNIKNYPLLLASMKEVTSHLEDGRLCLIRKAKSNVDMRNIDAEKISKLLGYPEN